jgi:hypothetical protein
MVGTMNQPPQARGEKRKAERRKEKEKHSCVQLHFLDCLILEYGTNILSQNIGNK